MIVTIHNNQLTLIADTLGAQMQSITSYKGTEYLWNGDERYWKGRAPVLFPFVARLKDKTYTVNGGTYQMKIHGFASACEFEVAEQTESSVTFALHDNEVTRAQFPFAFLFKVRHALKENTVEVTYTVDNPADEMLHFGLGGHPGFNVPFAKDGTEFTDYYLEFDKPADVRSIVMSPTCYTTREEHPFIMENGVRLALKHELFDNDAIVLDDPCRAVSIKNGKNDRFVRVEYPDMSYLGLWHAPHTEAPYVCIEPWVSLPSHSAYMEDIEKQEHLIALESGGIYENVVTIEVM